MDDLAAMRIASAGMAVQRARIQVISENLANVHTTGPNGPYQRKEAIFVSVPAPAFVGELDAALGEILTPEELAVIQSVAIQEIRPDGAEPIRRLEPGHPHADALGWVAYPNISVIREMTDLMEAQRSYEANLAVMRSSRQMIDRALEMLR